MRCALQQHELCPGRVDGPEEGAGLRADLLLDEGGHVVVAEARVAKAVRHLHGREALQPGDARLELLPLRNKRPLRLIRKGDDRARHVHVRAAEQRAQMADAGRQLLRGGEEPVAWLARDLWPVTGLACAAPLRVLEAAEVHAEQRPPCASRAGREEAVGERSGCGDYAWRAAERRVQRAGGRGEDLAPELLARQRRASLRVAMVGGAKPEGVPLLPVAVPSKSPRRVQLSVYPLSAGVHAP